MKKSLLIFVLSILSFQTASAIALSYSNYECHSMARLGPVKTFHIQIEEGIFLTKIVQVMYEGKYYPVNACITDQRPNQISFRCVPGTRVPLISVDCRPY